MSSIHVSTLGRLVVHRDDRELSQLPAQRLRCALLVYLALERRATREQILSLLWPDRDPERARHALSQTLYELRSTLGDDWVDSRGDTMLVDDEVSADVVEFEAAIEDGNWRRAVELYRGRFLDGIYLVNTREFEGWVDGLQSKLARRFRTALREAVGELRATGSPAEALRLARRGVELDPLDDEAQHQLILLLAESGQRTNALKQYDRYEELLRAELDVEPLEETMELIRRIREGELDEAGGKLLREPKIDEIPPEKEGAEKSESPEDREVEGGRSEPGPGRVVSAGGFSPELIPDAGRGAYFGQRTKGGLDARSVSLLGQSTLVAVGVGIFVLVLVAFLWMGGSPEGADADSPADPFAISALPASRIAVLYFDDHSADRSMGGLADGITETLIHELAQVPGLDVVPRNGSKLFRDRDATPWDSVASVLGAGTIIEGSVDGSVETARVTIRLVDAGTQRQLESTRLDLPLEDRFALLDTVAVRVGGLVQQRVGLEVRLDELRAGTTEEEALELVQSAESERRTAEALASDGALVEAEAALSRADSLLVRASELDEEWDQPPILRGWTALQRADVEEAREFDAGVESDGVAAHLRSARRIARTALDMAPESAEALELRGIATFRTWQAGVAQDSANLFLESAERDLRAAIREDPALARAHATLSTLLNETGHFEEALIHAEEALDRDGFLDNADDLLFQLGQNLVDLRRAAEAAERFAEGRRRFPDDQRFPAAQLSLLSYRDEIPPDVDRAWELAREMERLSPPTARAINSAYGSLQVAAVLARAGDRDSARAVMDRFKADPVRLRGDPGVPYLESIVWLELGQRDSALARLEDFVELMPQRRAYLAEDWAFDSLAEDSVFRALTTP
ncbi:MAG: BTAD domain-containing putative transcriptional regulator [Longimicrobiales bacterium]|nr:BTAD domain-containing putative transcriptional regulator [Longimicrobiales bacterium]